MAYLPSRPGRLGTHALDVADAKRRNVRYANVSRGRKRSKGRADGARRLDAGAHGAGQSRHCRMTPMTVTRGADK